MPNKATKATIIKHEICGALRNINVNKTENKISIYLSEKFNLIKHRLIFPTT